MMRPGRYAGNEIHRIVKDPDAVSLRFALAFPDLYEIGMSHPGFEILYHVLNRQRDIAAERVYAPWIDLETLLRAEGLPLFSLETWTPLREFDIVGFTLQYELQYTNILSMLDLSGIPLKAADRTADDPLVIAGGPCAFNPEPLAVFFDAVVLGDGEKAAVEVAGAVRDAGKASLTRLETLRSLASLPGVYVPSLYDITEKGAVPRDPLAPAMVTARTEPGLREEDYPEAPLVPLIEVTHDRLSLEVMRGCTRGCRFCSAGMIYRPERSRSADALMKHCRSAVAATGYEEISLVSLSTSDYPELPALLRKLRDWALSKQITVSFPSLRAETFTGEMAEFAGGFRKSGLTLAPEAGTQRLRDVINKNNTEDDLLTSVRTAFENGWKRVKLYFMIGLPTETDEDLQGIADLVKKAAAIARQGGRGEISVAISPFSPKPHTPFQWEAQDTPAELERKAVLLTRAIPRKGTKLHWRNPAVSRLETVLGRGDRRLGAVILRAYEKGARFDAWTEQFNPRLWDEAFQECGLAYEMYTGAIPTGAVLPWDHLGKGIGREFFLKEREKAFAAQTTADCAAGPCAVCGLMAHPVCVKTRNRSSESAAALDAGSEARGYGRGRKRIPHPELPKKIRLEYRKQGRVRLTSHLDVVRMFVRAFRRANISLAMSQGFNPHPKLAPGPPLPLGFSSDAEYMDAEIVGPLPDHFPDIINRTLPEGLTVTGFRWVYKKVASLSSQIDLHRYRIVLSDRVDLGETKQRIHDFMHTNRHLAERTKKGHTVTVEIRQYVTELSLHGNRLSLTLATGPAGTARVHEILDAIFPDSDHEAAVTEITREAQLVRMHGEAVSPLDIV
ncbi:TIGR03960 family B12-binding radical SAM protein [bacterium]|nr:TIGR03960 family B12-binding radical SAM protein [bacterium]